MLLDKALLNWPLRRGTRDLFIVLALSLHFSGLAQVQAQEKTDKEQFTISVTHSTVDHLIRIIKRQAHREVHIGPDLQHVGLISLDVRRVSAEELDKALQPKGLRLIAESKTLFIKSMPLVAGAPDIPVAAYIGGSPVSIQVVTEKGEIIQGVNIRLQRTDKTVRTKKDGLALLYAVREGDLFVVTHIGRRTLQLPWTNEPAMTVIMEPTTVELGETVVTNYYAGPDRLSTGNIGQLKSKFIVNQPVSDPLLTLAGWIPGLQTVETSGVHHAGVKLQCRGPVSIKNGKDLLILIDRVPYGPNNSSISHIATGNSAGSMSPLSLINPADIETIQLLKDADATAIYGSRGANGVLLITMKKFRADETRWGLSVTTGISAVTRQTRFLNTQQYVRMRREALGHDSLALDAGHAPELALWDTGQYQNFSRTLSGNLASYKQADLSLSQGGTHYGYRMAAHFLRQTDVFPGLKPDDEASVYGSLTESSANGRLSLQATGLFSRNWNHQYVNDLTPLELLTPNAPALRDSAGHVVFREARVPFTNPFASMEQFYQGISDNLLLNVYLQYLLSAHWMARLNLGYNRVHSDEVSRIPISSQDPESYPSPTGSYYSAHTNYSSLIIEPQIERSDSLGKWSFHYLMGASMQTQRNVVARLAEEKFPSDAVLGQPGAAGSVVPDRQVTDYHYAALYGRIHIDWNHTWLVNLTARRDGSSRFGPGRQFGNFGAVGVAWIFSQHPFVAGHLPFLSFGKLRASGGVTGNDQIGDYGYRTIWDSTNTAPGQGAPGYYPTNLANNNLAWEKSVKYEGAVEMGFFEDRLYCTAAYYRNRESNQLILYALPLQTGFSSELRNSGAVVASLGWEFTLRTEILHRKTVRWSAGLNLCLPRNKLLAFPNLASSFYAKSLVIGQSLNVVRAYRVLGVDRDSGIYRFADLNHDGRIDDADRGVVGSYDLRWYGGFNSQLIVGKWELDLHVDMRAQTGANFQAAISARVAPGALDNGLLTNQTQDVLNRWQHPGDRALYQQFSSEPNSPAGRALAKFQVSDGVMDDASFFRLKTVALSRQLPEAWLKTINSPGGRLYLRAQNLFTLTHYKGADPETQTLGLAPLRTIVVSIQVNIK